MPLNVNLARNPLKVADNDSPLMVNVTNNRASASTRKGREKFNTQAFDGGVSSLFQYRPRDLAGDWHLVSEYNGNIWEGEPDIVYDDITLVTTLAADQAPTTGSLRTITNIGSEYLTRSNSHPGNYQSIDISNDGMGTWSESISDTLNAGSNDRIYGPLIEYGGDVLLFGCGACQQSGSTATRGYRIYSGSWAAWVDNKPTISAPVAITYCDAIEFDSKCWISYSYSNLGNSGGR